MFNIDTPNEHNAEKCQKWGYVFSWYNAEFTANSFLNVNEEPDG